MNTVVHMVLHLWPCTPILNLIDTCILESMHVLAYSYLTKQEPKVSVFTLYEAKVHLGIDGLLCKQQANQGTFSLEKMG